MDQMIAGTEKKLKKIYQEALKDIETELTRIYAKYSADGSLTYAEMTKYNRLRTLESDILDIMNYYNKQAIKEIGALPPAAYDESFFRAGWAIDMASGVAVKWGQIPADTIRAAVENNLWYLAEKGMQQNSLNVVSKTITSGLIQGQSFPKMARAMSDAIGRTYRDALRIARTEGMRAYTLGTQRAFERAQDQGVDAREVWIASLDDRTRESHAHLDGKAKDQEKDGWYVSGLGYVAGPRLSGSAAFDINCRCDIGGEITGLEPKLRRTRESGVVPYTTYDDWKKNMDANGGVYVPERTIPIPEEKANFERNTV